MRQVTRQTPGDPEAPVLTSEVTVNVGQRGHPGAEVAESGSHVRRATLAAPILL